MKRFEYMIRQVAGHGMFRVEKFLNDQGEHGWELVNFHADVTTEGEPCTWLWFKRESQRPPKPTLSDAFQKPSAE